MTRSRVAWIVSAVLLTTPTEGRAEAPCPVVLRSCTPGTAVAVDRVAGVSFVDLEKGTCVEPWTLRVPAAFSAAATSGSGPPVGEAIVAIVAVAALLLAIIVGVAVYKVRTKALDTEFNKVALRDRRCSAAKEVASHCGVLLALLELRETGDDGLKAEREALKDACEIYRSKAPST